MLQPLHRRPDTGSGKWYNNPGSRNPRPRSPDCVVAPLPNMRTLPSVIVAVMIAGAAGKRLISSNTAS